MQPILFEALGFKVHAYGLMMALACASALGISVWRARREGMDADAVYELATWLFLGGVVGARALFVIVYPGSIHSVLDVFKAWEGGGVFYGCILGGLGGTLLYYRRRPFPFLKMADVVAPALAVGAFFGRIGCHLNGCCHGAVTRAAWGVRFPYGSHAWAEHVDHGLIPPDAPWSLPVHPTQLIASLGGLVLLVVLTAYFPYRRRPGQVMALLMIAYPITRWPVEVLRADDPGVFAGVTVSMLISLGLLAGGVALWMRLRGDEERIERLVLEGRPAAA
ncbi:prolipoprotein diacylglyceryl transferase [Paludisphaera mucosa]|uniref:Phosphatidylglycerol--prolipoprotein diacylglyceryl transferase n=1 Tax=Paludisphaera mucosa TaxID=3030827 RepID=A0ABT6F934_9BACT|nr:prolipoprotein diacylglyceryl transferase [Paludisphaera mucosa]MDG3004086.1 prolipoprotein diacylglyceryl transferase [Paludisphaera mucosa]